MNNNLNIQAIDASLNSSWKEAIFLNKKILKTEPKNTDALNRLAFAYQANGELTRAEKIYHLVLKIDPCNLIAYKSLKKFKEFNLIKGFRRKKQTLIYNNIFVEEQGKTRVVSLIKLATKIKLSQLSCGDKLIICPKKHRLIFQDEEGNYVGTLPDDLSYRLLDFIRKGNLYESYVRSVNRNSLLVFIKEAYKSARLKSIPSFPIKTENRQCIPNIDNQEKEEREETESQQENID